MSGIENDVLVAKNVNFDFLSNPPHNGIVSADGQLLIGSTANPNIAMVANTLTAGTGITITNGPGSITIASTASATDLHTARFIVASSTVGTGANYTSITSAIAAAVGTGINSTIFLQPGTYTENFTIPPGINIAAYNNDELTPNVTIVGKITMTAAGRAGISGVRLQTNGDFFLAVTGSAASIIDLSDCFLNCTNNTGISLTSSGGAIIDVLNCFGNIATTGISLFSQSNGTLTLDRSEFANSGNSTTSSTCSAGVLNVGNCTLASPITISGTGTINSNLSYFDCSALNTTALTLGGSGTQDFKYCTVLSGTASALSISTTALSSYCSISSSNASAIAGAGTFNHSGLTFLGSSRVISVTTQNGQVFKVGAPAYKYVSTAISYAVLSTDAIIGVTDNSSARTITMPNSGMAIGQRWSVKDQAGTAASANNITISGNGANIDGAATYVINTNFGSVDLYWNGSNFFII